MKHFAIVLSIILILPFVSAYDDWGVIKTEQENFEFCFTKDIDPFERGYLRVDTGNIWDTCYDDGTLIEYSCNTTTSGSGQYKMTESTTSYKSTIICVYGCMDGACQKKPIEVTPPGYRQPPRDDPIEGLGMCTETDKGIDITSKGTTSEASTKETDYCVGTEPTDTLREYYCTRYGKVGYKDYNCNLMEKSNRTVSEKMVSLKYTCEKGACMQIPETQATDTTRNIIDSTNETLEIETVNQTCSETDKGFNPLVKGETTLEKTMQITKIEQQGDTVIKYQPVLKTEESVSKDICIDTYSLEEVEKPEFGLLSGLKEYYCEGNETKEKSIDCSCEYGRCTNWDGGSKPETDDVVTYKCPPGFELLTQGTTPACLAVVAGDQTPPKDYTYIEGELVCSDNKIMQYSGGGLSQIQECQGDEYCSVGECLKREKAEPIATYTQQETRSFDKSVSFWNFLSDEKAVFTNSYKPYFSPDFFVYQYPKKIKPGTVIQSYGKPESQLTAQKESTFFFVDYYAQGAVFEHKTDLCLMAEQITCMKADWWPVVDGKSWINWGTPEPASPILTLPIIGGAMEWIWEKIFGKAEEPRTPKPSPSPEASKKPSRNDLKKIDSETSKKIEDFILSNPEKEDVQNIYALVINFMGTDQIGSEDFFKKIDRVNSAFEKTIGREKTTYLVPNETYFKEGADGLSTMENVEKAAREMGSRMTCKDRVIIFINGHGREIENSGGIKPLDADKDRFYPQSLTQYFPECATIYFVISSCFGAQYTELNSDPKVRAYYSGTGSDIIIWAGWDEPYYGFSSAFAHDFEKYYPTHKKMPDDLMLLTHLSVLDKDSFQESPTGYVKTNSISREIISDLLLKESFCTEAALKYDNMEDFYTLVEIARSRKTVSPVNIFLEKQGKCIKSLDRLMDTLPEIKKGDCKAAADIIDNVISEFQDYEEVSYLESYYGVEERQKLEKYGLFDKEKIGELEAELETRFGDLKNRIVSNLNELKSSVSSACS